MARTKGPARPCNYPPNYSRPSRHVRRTPPHDTPVDPSLFLPRLPPKEPPRFIHPRDRPRPASFSPFMRLPLELRLKIWQTCFPGPRRVRIDLGVLHHESTKLPRTLFINQESRRETLKQYTIVFPTDILKYPSGPITPPFCFDPRTDSLFCRADAMVSEAMSIAFPMWLDYLERYLSGGLKSIGCLLIDYGYFNSVPTNTVVEDMLAKLGGLTDLTVHMDHHVGDDIRVKLEQSLRSCLEKSKDEFVSQRLPKLTITI